MKMWILTLINHEHDQAYLYLWKYISTMGIGVETWPQKSRRLAARYSVSSSISMVTYNHRNIKQIVVFFGGAGRGITIKAKKRLKSMIRSRTIFEVNSQIKADTDYSYSDKDKDNQTN